MNPQSLLFMLMVVTLGGLIAYIADRLGRSLGKKRLKLFGLRPRHTAELLTVVAGALIPLITVLIVLSLSAGVREWLLHSVEVMRQRDDAIHNLNRAKSLLSQIQSDLDTAQGRLKKTEASLAESAKSLQALKKTETGLVNEVRDRTKEVHSAQAQLKLASAQYQQVNGQLVAVRRDYSSVKADYAKVNATYGELGGKYSRLQQSYKALDDQRKQANAEVIKDQAELDRVGIQLKGAQDQLAQTKTDYSAAQADLSAARKKLDDTNAELEQARARANLVGHVAEAARFDPIIFNAGDELARMTVPAGSSRETARRYIDELIHRSSFYAKAQGADKRGRPEESGLITLPIKNRMVTPAEQEEACLQAVSDTSEPTVILATAFWNTLKGENVPLVLQIFKDPLVYRKNQQIADTVIQGALPDDQIFQAISEFVKTKVQRRAKQDNMIPVAGRENGFGVVMPAELLNLVKLIRNWGRPVRLVAYVDQDVRAADSLDLKFHLQ